MGNSELLYSVAEPSLLQGREHCSLATIEVIDTSKFIQVPQDATLPLLEV